MRLGRRIGRLQHTFFVAALIVGMLPGVAALWATYLFSTASLKQAIGESLQEIARATALRLAGAVDHHIDRVERLAVAPLYVTQPVRASNAQALGRGDVSARTSAAGRPTTQAAQAATVAYLHEWMRESPDYVRVTVVDGRGHVVAATDPSTPADQADQLWRREAMQAAPGAVYVSGLIEKAGADDRLFHIAVPILDEKTARPIGAIDVMIRRALLTQMILPIHIGATGHGMLLDTQGTPLICPMLPPTAHLIPPSLLNRLTDTHPLWLVAEDDAHGGRNAIVGAAPVRFEHALTPAGLGGDRWYAFIRQAPEETYTPIYALLVRVGLIGFGLVMVLSGLAFFAGSRIVRPLTALQREAEGLRRNLAPTAKHAHQPDPPAAPEAARTGDEIEDLAVSFAAMRQVLEERLGTIRAQQSELIRKEKLASVGQLLAALAHDLRNPLGVIRSSAQIVLDGPREEPIRQEMARYIIDEVDKLSHRIHDFLRYARQKPPDRVTVPPADLLREAQRQWEAQGGQDGIVVEPQFDPHAPTIHVDPEQVKEALVNLLMNSREAMPGGGRLRVATGVAASGEVDLIVADSGQGIEPAQFARIFEPFYTTKAYGTGLGLTNVKRLVEDSGGTITLTSRPGEGTTCRLRFPAAGESR